MKDSVQQNFRFSPKTMVMVMVILNFNILRLAHGKYIFEQALGQETESDWSVQGLRLHMVKAFRLLNVV